MEEYWKYSYLQVIIIDLLVELEIVTASEFSKCFIKFLPKLLQSLVSNNDLLGFFFLIYLRYLLIFNIIVVKTLQSLNFFGTTLDNHLHLVFPSLIDLLGHSNTSITSEAQATVTRLGIVNLRSIAFTQKKRAYCQPFAQLSFSRFFLSVLLIILSLRT